MHVLRGAEEVDGASDRAEQALPTTRELTGPFDVIGDVHGCRAELEALLGRLGYEIARDEAGRPVDAVPPAAGPRCSSATSWTAARTTPGVLRLVMGMVDAGHALCVPGNHENKLVRALSGKKCRSGTAWPSR